MSYPNGAYYPQSQDPYHYQHTGAYATAFGAQPAQYGAPPWPTSTAPSAGHTPGMPRPKHMRGSNIPDGVQIYPSNPIGHASRHSGSTHGHGHKKPLKSAMKKPHADATPVARTRTVSDSRQNTGSRPSSRHQQTQGASEYLFLTFHGSCEFRVKNIYSQELINALREEILPMWAHGVESETTRGNNWLVRFSGQPWRSRGIEGVEGRRIVCRIFSSITGHGYRFVACINPANPSPRYVFIYDPDAAASRDFFTATVSRGGHRLTFIDPPREFGESLGPNLRSAMPRQIKSDRASEDGRYVVELSNRYSISDSAPQIFTTHVWRNLAEWGYGVMAAVPMARGGPLGLGSRKELWIIKSTHGRHRTDSFSRRERK